MIKQAQIKLTLWYVLIIMSITVSISALVYRGVSDATERALEAQRKRLERRLTDFPGGKAWMMQRPDKPMPLIDEDTLSEVNEGTMQLLILINLGILLITGGLGYILAGITLKPIDEMIKGQKRFISDAAHEIKTPLTIMKTNLEVTLRDKKLKTQDAKEALSSAITEIDKLNLFINKLLKKSRYQSGKNGLIKEKFSLTELIRKIETELYPLAKAKGISMKSKLDEVDINADKNMMSEMLTNLIENAIKYSNSKGKVDISLKNSAKFAKIQIKDNGIGIAKDDLQHIFEPFYRADKSRSKTEREGFGLGLSIVKDIVDKHHGTIKIESELSKGTIINLSLPINS